MIPLNRALSKLGILSRSEATTAILAGRVSVDGRPVRRPTTLVELDGLNVAIDGVEQRRSKWRTILFHKPRGVVTTKRDPEGRKTVFDVLGDAAEGMIAVGRLDLASTGLLLLTTDTALADRITDPRANVPRVYIVTVRGRVTPEAMQRLVGGADGMAVHSIVIQKASGRESHLAVELREGKNREIRRLMLAAGHEVTRLKRVRFGGLELGALEPARWREVSRDEMAAAFPDEAASNRRATTQDAGSRSDPTSRKAARATRRSLRSRSRPRTSGR